MRMHTGHVHVQTGMSMRTPDTSMHKPDISMHTHVHVHTRHVHLHVDVPMHTPDVSIHTPDRSLHTHTLDTSMHTHPRQVPAHTHTDVSMCTLMCPRTNLTYPCTHAVSMCKPDTSTHTNRPDTSMHTKRPDTLHTHTPDQRHVPAAGATSDPEIPGAAGAGTRVDFLFPQAHTSVHVYAARCYLCNHIATPPQILPYKDIGSHCRALFMAFHTHTRMHTATALLQLRTQ